MNVRATFRNVFGRAEVLPGICVPGCTRLSVLPNQCSPERVEQVKAGQRTTANAARWGFGETDSTDALQSAIYSGARAIGL